MYKRQVDTDAELVACQNGGIEVALLDRQVVALDHTTAAFRLFDTAYGEMYCLDLKDNLKTLWVAVHDMFFDHSNVIGGNGRVLVWTQSGDLLLLDAAANEFKPLRRLRPFGDGKVDSMSHPAIVGDRLYLRGPSELACFELRKE